MNYKISLKEKKPIEKTNLIPVEFKTLDKEDSLSDKSKWNMNSKFKSWFGNSVIVNEDGSPKIVYHGTRTTFSDFIPSLKNDIGSHFGNLTQSNFILISDVNEVDLESEYYKGMHIKPCFVRIERPLYMEDLTTWDIQSMGEFLMENNLMSPNMINSLQIKYEKTYYGKDVRPKDSDTVQDNIKRTLVHYIKKAGYDGIIYDNTSEGDGESYMVFDPNQIKSVFNRGSWSNESNNISENLQENEEKIVKAYKLFRVNKKYPGKLFPLFVDSNNAVPLNVWIDAKHIAPNSAGGIQSKLGPLAYRPGWHSGDAPVATHIGLKNGGSTPALRNPDYVWAEVLVNAEVDWQTIANQRATLNKQGKPIARTAHITDQIPKRGFYRYKTNPNMTGTWIISGEIKVLRVLSDEEVEIINNQSNMKDLPRTQPMDLKYYGFDDNGLPIKE